MSRRVHVAPVALASNGTVIVNLATFDIGRTPASLLRAALAEPGQLFVGVELSTREAKRLVDHVQFSVTEGAAFTVGRRQREARKRRP